MSEESLSEVSLLDSSQIDMLKETAADDASELFRELKDLFDEETGPIMQELEQVVKEPNPHRIERLAHSLAGSSSNLGLLRLSQQARTLENSDLTRPHDELAAEVEQLKTLYEESCQALEDLIREL